MYVLGASYRCWLKLKLAQGRTQVNFRERQKNMSLCTKCNYKVDDKVWCLHFSNPMIFTEHAKNVLTTDKCDLYKNSTEIKNGH